MSYEQKTKLVDQMTRQITHDKMIILKDRGLTSIPDPLRFEGIVFGQLLTLDLQNNNISDLDGIFCQNFPSLQKLDLRNNKLKSINPHIKALMSLTTLRLDGN